MDRMDIYKILAGMIKVAFTGKKKGAFCEVRRNEDKVEFVIKNHPVYPSGIGDIIVSYPYTWLNIGNANGHVSVRPSTITSQQVRFWQGHVGESFKHAHVFDDGHPCWGHNNQNLSSVVEVMKNLIMCLRFVNITDYSLEVGLPATRSFGTNTNEMKRNAKTMVRRVDDYYGLESYSALAVDLAFSREFNMKVSMLRWY